MALTGKGSERGFNPRSLETLLTTLDKAYGMLESTLWSKMQEKFIDKLADCWYSSEAKEFFEKKFKPAMDAISKSAYETFRDAFETIDEAGRAKAAEHGCPERWKKHNFGYSLRKVSVAAVKDVDANGNIGIDTVRAVAAVAALSTVILTGATAALGVATGGVAVASAMGARAFLDSEELPQLKKSFESIKKSIEQVVEELAKAVNTAIEATISRHEALSKKIVSAFTISSK